MRPKMSVARSVRTLSKTIGYAMRSMDINDMQRLLVSLEVVIARLQDRISQMQKKD